MTTCLFFIVDSSVHLLIYTSDFSLVPASSVVSTTIVVVVVTVYLVSVLRVSWQQLTYSHKVSVRNRSGL